MSYKRLIIVGAGQTAEQIYYLAKEQRAFDTIVFAVDAQYRDQDTLCGTQVLDLNAVLRAQDKMNDAFFVAMSWNRLNHYRTVMYYRIKEHNLHLASIVANKAAIYANAEMGDNVWVSEHSIVGCLAKLENNVYIQPGASVLHNAIIRDHCFIGASSVIGGNSKIGPGSFVGLGAVVHNDVTIGRKCIIGAGAIVRRDLPDYSIVYAAQSKATVLDKLTVRS